MRIVTIILTGSLLVSAVGCENASSRKTPLADQVEKLTQEKTQLQSQVEQSKSENEQLMQQIQVLSGLPEGVKTENIYSVHGIKLTRYTNFYDKDKDGKKEKLIVYIQPIDQEGDIIKAAGDVDVQLVDLNKLDAPLGQWHVTAEQLRKIWFKTLLTVYYRLTFDVAGKVENFKDPLTVTVTFTDHLTGKVFKEHKVITPR
ncbi:MAG: bZIP transcription factor [Planctomycetota bacterium]|nr:bZIP transcription factor [Planctomycetota bacterium]